MEPEMSQVSGPTAGWRRRVLPLAALLAASVLALAQLPPPPCVALGGSFCSQPVGLESGAHNVPVEARTAGTVAAVEVLTLGAGGLDFAPGIGLANCAGATLSAGSTCTESVTFTPIYPGLRVGAVVLLDSRNNVLGSTVLSAAGVGGLGVLIPGNIRPVAGDGTATGPILDGSAAGAASLDNPTGVALDGAGNLYIADRDHNRIRKVTAATGLISTLAGNGTPAYAGDGLISTNAAVSVNAPTGLAVDGAGNLYIADTGNQVIREINSANGVISTVAGTGAEGSTGDLGPATAATLHQPQGVSIDSAGNLYIADTANQRIRRVDASTGIVATIAGNGTAGFQGDTGLATAAELNLPLALAFDAAGNLYIADSGNNAVRQVAAVNGVIAAASTIITFAGTGAAGYTGDGASANMAMLSSPSGVAADAAGNLYIADTGNAGIRKVSSATGFISTIARNNTGVYVNDNGGPYSVSIAGPTGLVLDSAADLYFADSLNNRVRQIQANFAVLDYLGVPIGEGAQSAARDQSVENDGNAGLQLTSIAAGVNAALDQAVTTCNPGAPALAVNAGCAIGAIFAPAAAGNPLFGGVMVAEDAANAPLTIGLAGDASQVFPTTTTLDSSVNPSGFGQPVTFIATVAGGAAAGIPTGKVTFLDGATVLGAPVAVNGSGAATWQTAALAAGVHAIAASYAGDSTHASGVSAVLTQSVLEATSTAMVSSVNPSAVGQSVTFTATVKAAGGGAVAPQGNVTFTDGEAILATVPLGADGVAACATANLANGSHAISAAYTGDAALEVSASVSILLTQEVLFSSQVSLNSAPNPSNLGGPVTFTVTAKSSGTQVPTGVVNILDAGNRIGLATLVGSTGIGSFITTALARGSHSITAAYQGDANNAPSTSVAITQQVNKAQTSIALSAAPNPSPAGATVTLTAIVEDTGGSATPAGTVVFADAFQSATVTLGSAPLGAAGTAILNPALAPGLHSIVATYGGDAGDNGSVSAPLAVTVQPAATNTVLTSSPDPSVAASAVAFTATVTGNGAIPTGSVTFFADGASIGFSNLNAKGVATLSNSSLMPGTHSVTAGYAGDQDNAASTSLPINQVVDTLPTTTALAAASVSGTASLSATVSGDAGPSPTGTVTFTAGVAMLGSAPLDSTGVAAFAPTLSAGVYTVVAAYGGDAWHSPSTSRPISITEAASAFNLAVAPSTVYLQPSQNATATVTLVSTGGFTDNIALACANLPTGVTCQFSKSTVTLAANGSAAAQLTIDTAAAIASTRPANRPGATGRGLSLAGLFLPIGFLSACLVARRAKGRGKLRHGALLLLLLCAALLATGCTVLQLNPKKAASCTIQVTGTGAASNLVESANMTLNLAQ